MIHTQFQSHRYNGCSEATTIRQPSTALLTIDSADRFKDQPNRRNIQSWDLIDNEVQPRNFSAYDFTITKNESIMNGFFTRLAVSEIVFPWAIPNINDQTSRINVTYQPTGVGPVLISQIIIPTGFYRPQELAGTIQAEVRTIDASLAAFVIDYSDPDYPNTFTYATNSAADVGFAPVSYDSTEYNNNTQVIQLFDLLGFTDSNLLPQSSQAGVPTLCQFTRYVDIVCAQLTYNQGLKDTSSQRTVRDALCRVYLADATFSQSTVDPADASYCPPGCAPTVLYRNFSQPKQIQWTPNQPVPGFLQFQVYDDNGIPLSESGANAILSGVGTSTPSPGVDWSMTLLVSEN
jgi:hypothetical protein